LLVFAAPQTFHRTPESGSLLVRAIDFGEILSLDDSHGARRYCTSFFARANACVVNVLCGRAAARYRKRVERCRQRVGIFEEELPIMKDTPCIGTRWFEEVWNQRKRETIYELLAPDSVAHSASSSRDLVGPEAWEQMQ